ncbi:MAG: anthranilate synthase component I family protein [Bacteroidales bacterium]
MRNTIKITVDNIQLYKQKLHFFALQFDYFLILDSTQYPAQYEYLAALGSHSIFTPQKNYFDELFNWHQSLNDWIFGHLAYDLKNHIEALTSSLPDYIQFPQIFFFQPKYLIQIDKNNVIYHYLKNTSSAEIIKLHQEILNTDIKTELSISPFKKRITKQHYIEQLSKIEQHIQLGDIYEVNYCQEFYHPYFIANPATCYNQIRMYSPMPFSAFYKINQKFLLSASPERYLKKLKNKVISQPIKGTIKRTLNEKQNQKLKQQLQQNKKDRAENIMIVDLVRNDLSRTAIKNSVKVKELCQIYEFPTVFQMISTIESTVKPETRFTDIIKTTFPMGSMTGAPKIKAMEIIEKYESVKRGLYSGSVGYISPKGDFDFNVVIRSLQINYENNYASIITGGAITILSNAEDEYNECFVKAQALLNALNTKIE